jgi:predicted nucleic acid-binding protein
VPLLAQVIADTSGLKPFAEIGRLDLLATAFTELLVPPGVRREILARNSAPNMLLVDALRLGQTLQPLELSEGARIFIARYSTRVDPGESEVIALAKTHHLPVLMDDLDARLLAAGEGVAVVGSLGVLAYCKKSGVINQVKPVAEAMRLAGRFFGAALLRDFYRRMGEE